MKKLLIVLSAVLSISSFASDLIPFMSCKGTNQYGKEISVSIATQPSNGLTESIEAQVNLGGANDSDETVVEGTILNKPDFTGNYQFISADDRVRFLTSGTVFSLDDYGYRSANLTCEVLAEIFTSKGNSR